MSNEEKILSMLEIMEKRINDRLDKIEDRLDKIEATQKQHSDALKTITGDLQIVKNDVATIKRVVCIQSGRLDDLDRAIKIG